MLHTYDYVCRYCRPEHGRTWNCKLICKKYLDHIQLSPPEKAIRQKISYKEEIERINKLGYYKGYYFLLNGKIKCKYKDKYLNPLYRKGIPYISLSENNITEIYRLDQAVYRAFHCTYVINSKNIKHIDGNQMNCSLKNLLLI